MVMRAAGNVAHRAPRLRVHLRALAAPVIFPLELRYFKGYAKGLGPALVAEYSGLEWKGNKDLGFHAATQWPELKPHCPFGQMPLLTLANGHKIAQTPAIINALGKLGGIEGERRTFAVSQMLLAEAEDIYALMLRALPTKLDDGTVLPLGAPPKGTREDYDAFWSEALPQHLGYLEKLCAAGEGFDNTPGSLHLFSMLYQLDLIKPGLFAPGNAACAELSAWYRTTLAADQTQKVVTGASSAGELAQYFLSAKQAAAA